VWFTDFRKTGNFEKNFINRLLMPAWFKIISETSPELKEERWKFREERRKFKWAAKRKPASHNPGIRLNTAAAH
jgi:hypothetical protein